MRARWHRRTTRQTRLGAVLLGTFVVATMVTPRRAPAGTIAEQRARLPPPATCDDPIEGTWKSHDYRPRWRQWSIFTLEMKRVDGTNKIEGTITNNAWRGDDTESEPGVCRGERRFVVSMDARGEIRDGFLVFSGFGEYRLEAHTCGTLFDRYNLDSFSGPLDLELLEFQAVNNDGGRAVNEPTVFRRVECVEKKAKPKVGLKPPPFYPPKEAEGPSGGCSG